MKTISRKEFIEQMGWTTAAFAFAACLGSCKKTSNAMQSSNVDFTINVSTGALAANGGYLVQNGVIIARTSSGSFIAVSAACTHQGGTLYFTNSNIFQCPLHGATFDASGKVLNGPATTALQKYNTALTGTSLRVYS